MLATAGTALGQDEDLRSYFTANGLLNRGLYAEAAAEYSTFLETDPRGDEAATARYGLAVSLSQLGRSEDALAQLDALDAPSGFAFQFEAGYLEGQLLYGLRRFDDAARQLSRLVRRQGDHPRAADAAGLWIECLHRLGEHREAVQRTQELLDTDESSGRDLGRAILFAGLSLSAIGQDDQAASALERLLDRDDEIGHNAALSAAGAYVRLGRLDDASENYERLIRLGDERWYDSAQLGLARVRRAEGGFGQAVAILRDLLEGGDDSPSRAEGRLELGINLVETGEHEEARRMLSTLPASASDAIAGRASYWIAKSLLREGDAESAARRLERSLEQFPDSPIRPEMLYDWGVALNESGQPELAVAAFERLPAEHGTHRLADAARLASATTLLRLGQYDAAFERADSIDSDAPESVEAALILAECDAMLGRHGRTIDRLTEWMQEHAASDASDRARYRLAMSLASVGELGRAERLAEPIMSAQRVDPRFKQGLLVLGDAAFAAENWERAEHWFRSAVAQHTEPRAAAQLKLGLALARQARHGEAEDLFEIAASNADDSDITLQALFELGQARLVLGDEPAAAATFETLLESGGESRFAGYAMQHLGGIAERAGNPDAATEWYDRAAATGGDIARSARRDQARAALAAGRFDVVRDIAEGARDADLRAFAGIALSREGDHEGAIDALEAVLRSDDLSREVRRSAQFERAWCLRQTGEEDSARDALTAIASATPTDRFTVYAALESASIELDAGNAERSNEALDRAIEVLDDNPGLAEPAMLAQRDFRLAQRENARGRHQAVVDLLRTFADDHAGSLLVPSANLLLGDAYIATSHPKLAVGAFQASVDEGTGEIVPAATLRLGDALGQSEAWAESREVFESFLAANPRSPFAYEAQFGIAWALEHEGQLAEARDAYAVVVNNHDGPTAARAQFQIGECLFAEGMHDEAVRELLRVDILYDYPEWSSAALYEAGRAFEQLRKFGEARQQYRDTIERFPDTSWSALAQERLDRLSAASGG